MALVFPVAAREQLVGSAVLLAQHGNHLLFCTALHIIGEYDDIRIAVPPHQGNCALPQTYPVYQTPALAAHIVASNPFADIVILAAEAETGPNTPLPRIATAPGQIAVGSDVVVLGYPFAPIGSFLQTWSPGSVVALARHQVIEGVTVDEVMRVGHIPVTTSSSFTVATSGHYLHEMLRIAKETLDSPEGQRTSGSTIT